jgi:hypothetical protein
MILLTWPCEDKVNGANIKELPQTYLYLPFLMKILRCVHFKNNIFEETNFVPSIIRDDSFDLALQKQSKWRKY